MHKNNSSIFTVIKENNYIDDGNLKFYIEEAQLVHKNI